MTPSRQLHTHGFQAGLAPAGSPDASSDGESGCERASCADRLHEAQQVATLAVARLAAAEARFRTVFEHSPIGMLLLDRHTGPFLVNAAAARIHGVTPSELIGVGPEEAFEGEQGAEIASLVDELWRGERDAVQFEGLAPRPDGVAVWVRSTTVMVPDEDEPYLYVQIEDISDRRNAEAALLTRAYRDGLTGLDNRACFADHLEAGLSRRGDGELALLLLDLDGFKAVNDGLGHQAGDAVLAEAARRLSSGLGSNDRIGRLGGDEFAVLLRGPQVTDQAIAVAMELARRLSEPFTVEGVELRIAASVGIARSPVDGSDAGTLMRKADIAMYRAKRLGYGWALYRPDEDDMAAERIGMIADLRKAVADEELSVAYQPMVEPGSGRVVSFEALARWKHRRRGAVSPDVFIGLAEQAGLIEELTRLILRQAIAACARWRADGHDVRVAVNASVHVLQTDGLAAVVTDQLDRAGLAAEHLTLEITESALADDPDGLRASLAALRDAGIELAIDDFGTGYSALAYLKHLPVQEIKVDASFVREIAVDPRDASIVGSLVDLAHGLGMSVVAEGVEDAEGVAILAGIGCDRIQGYTVCRPMPEPKATAWLESASGAAAATRQRAGEG